MMRMRNKLGIDICSTTVKIAILDDKNNVLFSDYERHFANIRETLLALAQKAYDAAGGMDLCPMITGSGGMAISKALDIPFVQEVISVSSSLELYAPQTDVAIELGGEDAKIIYFTGGNTTVKIKRGKQLFKMSDINDCRGLRDELYLYLEEEDIVQV